MRVFLATPPLSRPWRLLLAAALLMLGGGFAHAQANDDNQGDAGDPPARVARLSYASGDLGLMSAGSTGWSAADVNQPLTNGDKLSSGPNARAELELGGASVRVDGQSDIGVLHLDEQIGQFELTQGTLSVTVRSLDEGATYEIDTPTLALVINQPGTFRVDVGANGNGTTVTVLDGGAAVYGESHAQREVFSGRRYQFADSTLNDVVVSDNGNEDTFDAWCSERDARHASADSAQYVSSDVVGAQDLNQYGDWQVEDDYGAVWYPADMAADWAPYRYGHWAWVGPWGWTWVDASPWGFAPYHYGRWAFVRNRWGWIPGPSGGRSIYAPALVAFVGMGAGGPVGWFPLGPREVYSPWYRASHHYYTQVNVTNITLGRGHDHDALINDVRRHYDDYRVGRPFSGTHYAYRDAPHAFTVVSAQAFANARNVQGNRLKWDSRQMAGTTALAPTALQRPSSASFGQPRTVNAHPLPTAGFSRPVVAVHAPVTTVAAGARFHAGEPASNVRLLGVRAEDVPRVVTGRSFPDHPTVLQQPQIAPRPAAPVLPQVPHFESAQQVRQVEQAPHYAPQPQPPMQQEERQQMIEQQRFNAAQQSHQYVPEQPQPYRYQPNPQPFARPEMGHPEQQSHPQNAPRAREYAPESKGSNH